MSKTTKNLKPLLNEASLKKSMADHAPRLHPQEALAESQRCLFCFDAPCIAACPAGIDIPSFIKKIATGNLTGSAQTILEANVLGGSCAQVCPTEVLCEGACVLQTRDHQPIRIGRLQRVSMDHVYENGIDVLTPHRNKSGKQIALLGGGPASLSCAAELLRLGHDATIFEKNSLAGGLNTYGIAYYKMTPERSLDEVDMIRRLGVKIQENCTVGKDIHLKDLQAEYDALYIGIGLGRTRPLGIPGENAPEVIEALDFIKALRTQPLDTVPIGKNVAVIGCGNTAIDAVTQAIRLGAHSSTILYRRGQDDMPAYDFEYRLAKNDGCNFVFFAQPTEIVLRDGHVIGVRVVRTQQTSSGTLTTVPESEWVIPCDMVIKALGQETHQEMLQQVFPGLLLNRSGCIVHDKNTYETSMEKVYTGGDCANGGLEVVHAVGEGKKAAQAIHERLTNTTADHPVQPSRMGSPQGPRGSGILKPAGVPNSNSSRIAPGR